MRFLKVAACFAMMLLSFQAISQSRSLAVCKSGHNPGKVLEFNVKRCFDYAARYVAPKKAFRCSFLMLNNLAKAAELIEEKEAFQCIESLLVHKNTLPETRISELIGRIEESDCSRSVILSN